MSKLAKTKTKCIQSEYDKVVINRLKWKDTHDMF